MRAGSRFQLIEGKKDDASSECCLSLQRLGEESSAATTVGDATPPRPSSCCSNHYCGRPSTK